MIFNFKTYSPEETEKQAFKLAGYLKQGDLILLCGDLGAGKTYFVKGLVKGIKSKGKVTSPSFVILKEYGEALKVYHFDLYRLQKKEIDEIGVEEYLYGDGVVVIEWGDRLDEKYLRDYLRIEMKRTSDELEREFNLKYRGKTWEDRIQRWLK